MHRLLLVAVVAGGLVLAGLAATPGLPARAQTVQEMEISDSCIAVRQRIPTLTVWGSGWGSWLANGGRLVVEWHWGGEPSTPRPATVNPPSQAAGASFTLVFDATGISPAFSQFGLIAISSAGARTLVGWVNLDIKDTCPTGTTTCLSDQGKPLIDAAVRGYDVNWIYEFWYQYRKAGEQQGPFDGALGSDGAVHGQLRGLSQVANATITAKIFEPPQGDSGGGYWFVTFPAPICNPPPPTTTTTASGATTTTTTVPDETTTTTRPSSTTTTTRPTGPTTTIPVPPAVELPPPTPGATLTLTPKLGPTGFVTGVRGTGFPPNTTVQLHWHPGVGSATALVGADGIFATRVLVLPNDQLGPRALVATSGATTAFDAFLVVPSTVQPSGGQNVAQLSRIRRFLKR